MRARTKPAIVVKRSGGRVWNQPGGLAENDAALGGEVSGETLTARVRKTHLGDGPQFFQLDVALEVPPGITILFGASGAGKSTLLDCIAGLAQPDSGRIAIGGDVLFDSERKLNA